MKSASSSTPSLVLPFEQLSLSSISLVGGKNASLGEMIRGLSQWGIKVPSGFATTVHAYRQLLQSAGLTEQLHEILDALDTSNVEALQQAGETCRNLILDASLPLDLEEELLEHYRKLGSPSVAVRSSATSEDLPQASFAGQHDTYLNIKGEEALLSACRRCYASLFTDRAICYRQLNGFDHLDVALSVGVQCMVRSDLACSGVMFSLDTESGFRDVVLLTAAYGLGESVVQGSVNPDEYLIFKPTLLNDYEPIISQRLGSKENRLVFSPDGSTEYEAVQESDRRCFALDQAEVLQLARWACEIEAHYSRLYGSATPMDIEWAKDGSSGELFIVQARPETVHSHIDNNVLRSWHLEAHNAELLCVGRAIGASVSCGPARVLNDPSEIERFQSGDVLVTDRTDPDWEPLLKLASGVLTNRGGRTCHAAIIAREMGITAIVGAINATDKILDGEIITLSCCEGNQGRVYRGVIPFRVHERDVGKLPSTRTQILMNVGNPEDVFNVAAIPCDGVGLARLEFIIANQIRVHPMALLHPTHVLNHHERADINRLTAGYDKPSDYYVDMLAQAIGHLAAAFFPRPVLLRFSDFKSNEYSKLLGGSGFEPAEENPMIGWRGASRYYSEGFREAFALECQAIYRVRQRMGLDNIIPMVPFCRTPEEGDRVLAEMALHGLVRGEHGLQVYVMCELPSNVIAAEAFAQRFDGFSIGSNDLTQLTLGIDRDSALVGDLFDERHPAVLEMIRMVIRTAKKCGRKIGICGQAPSDYPEFTKFLIDEGIDSISLNPDAVIEARLNLARFELQSC